MILTAGGSVHNALWSSLADSDGFDTIYELQQLIEPSPEMLLSSLFLSPTKAILSTLKLLQQLRNYFHIHRNISRAANGLLCCSRDWPEPGSPSCWLPGAAVSWLVTSHSQKAAPVSCLLTENSLCPRIPHNTSLIPRSHIQKERFVWHGASAGHRTHQADTLLTVPSSSWQPNLYWPAMRTSNMKPWMVYFCCLFVALHCKRLIVLLFASLVLSGKWL